MPHDKLVDDMADLPEVDLEAVDDGHLPAKAEVQPGEVAPTGSERLEPQPQRKASWLLLAMLFFCGVGTFARTEVFVLQTRYFTVCAGYGKDYFPFMSAAVFMPPIFFLWLETKVAPILIYRCGARMYSLVRIFTATISSILVLVTFAALFSPGRDAHPADYGFYLGLVIIGWGASTTYETVTGIISTLPSSCFAAFFVGTYSPSIVFGPINLATGELCTGEHANDADGVAVALQFGASALLVAVVCAAFYYTSRQKAPMDEYANIDAGISAIVGLSKDEVPQPLTALQRYQLQTWISMRNMNADPWIKLATEFGITERTWRELREVGSESMSPTTVEKTLHSALGTKTARRASTVVNGNLEGESTTDGDGPAARKNETTGTITTTPPAARNKASFLQACLLSCKPASGLFVNTLVNLVATGMYVRLTSHTVSLFYEYYLGTAVGATLTLSPRLKKVGVNMVISGVALRSLFLAIILPAVYHPGSLHEDVLHVLNVPWSILGGFCYTMCWIKASCIEGGSRIMPIVYFMGVSVGIIIVIFLNEHEKSQE